MRILIGFLYISIFASNSIECVAQKEFKYKFNLGIDSSHVSQEKALGQGTLSIKVVDAKGQPIDFAYVKIKSIELDTFFITDSTGVIELNPLPGAYLITSKATSCNPIIEYSIEIKKDEDQHINIVLGQDRRLKLGVIRSKRKLSKGEIDSIIKSLQNNEPNILIETGICRISWEI